MKQAGREVLTSIVLAIDAGRFGYRPFPFLAECLWLYVSNGVPLARALCVEGDKSVGGAPLQYDPLELAAVDLLLRDHAGFSPAEAVAWIRENIGADRKAVATRRKASDTRYRPTTIPLMESASGRPLAFVWELA